MAVTVEQFIERLTQSGLMSAAEVSTFQDSLPPDKRPKDLQQFAQALVQQGKLTKYQAQAVYEGKTKGLVFGQYVVLDKLGAGGMGVVLKAQHRRMKRTVAIKVLSSAAMKQAGAVERFHREAEAAAKLSHPNIVTAYDADEHQGMHYLAMEYVEGSDLATVVKEHGPLAVQHAVECILQAARGLQYAHSKGIVHRDIKPGNLLLDKEGTVKILDMGLARIVGAEAALGGAERLTTTGQVMGTCDYMAPEQSLDTHQADARADIYSLGCTLFRLLTGNPPYRGETFAKLFLMHLESPIPSLCDARPDVPKTLDAVCQRMLAKKPEDRYQSMTELITELEMVLAVLSGRSVTTTAASDESPSEVVARTLAFLQEATPRGTLTKQKKSTADQRTQPYIGPERDTGSNLLSKLKRVAGMARRRPLLLLAIGAGLVVLLVVVLALTLRQGTLVVEIDEQLGKDVQVAVSQGGERVQVADAKSGWTLSLSAGKYDLAVEGGDDQFQLDSESITVTRGGQVKVKVTLKPAVAPFDAQRARKYQERWAKQLGVPVEITNSIGMKLVLIPPGEFQMGSPKEMIDEEFKANGGYQRYKDELLSEGPMHRVRITRLSFLGMHEVTQEEYQRVMGSSPSEFSVTGTRKDAVAGQDTKRFPVESVSWDDAVEFCRRLSALPEERLAGRTYHLPSEAQWEYACRAGNMGRYSFSSGSSHVPKEAEEQELSNYGWFGGKVGETMHAVGLKRANAWGLYDMHGNVFEWCQDWYDKDYYAQSVTDDPAGPPGNSKRVGRGGSNISLARESRSAYRLDNEPGTRSCYLGFRACLVLPDTAAERAKMIRTTDAAQPSGDATTDNPSPSSPIPNPQPPTPLPAAGSLVGPDGKWKLPPGASPPAVAPFDAPKAKEHQERWAKHLGVPVQFTSSFGMEFVLVPPGEFMMGSDDSERLAIGSFASEKPIHKVRISKPFYIGKYIVTVAQFRRFVEAAGHRTEAEILGKGWTVKGTEWEAQSGINWKNPGFKQDESHPAVVVSWDDAQKFCEWATGMSGRTVRLPAEAEWEYAARGPMGLKYPWGNQWDGTLANHADQTLKSTGLHLWSRELDWSPATDGYAYTSPVGVFRNASWCGAFDMAGNVWEWCQDWASDTYYAQSPPIDPPGPMSGTQRVCRGGPWNDPGASLRSACRLRSCYPYCLAANEGFRVIMEVPGVTKGLPTHASESTDRKAASGTQQSPSIGADGEWQLPPGAPPPAIAPFDATKAKEHQNGWAKHLGVPVEMTNSIGMKLVLIPPGEFMMGSPKELIEEELKTHGDNPWYKDHLAGEWPQHRVRITKPFYFGVYVVTQGEYQQVMGNNPSEFSAGGKSKDKVAGQDTKRFPVETVSWDNAVEFCRKLSEMPEEKGTGRTYCLPSETQWEYACRAGNTGRYSFSSDANAIPNEFDEKAISDYGWFGDNSDGRTHAVGLKRANAWGLRDIQGNVLEWCQDWYDKDSCTKSATDNPVGASGGSYRVFRGGSWRYAAWFCRSAYRDHYPPGDGTCNLGFRVSLVLPGK